MTTIDSGKNVYLYRGIPMRGAPDQKSEGHKLLSRLFVETSAGGAYDYYNCSDALRTELAKGNRYTIKDIERFYEGIDESYYRNIDPIWAKFSPGKFVSAAINAIIEDNDTVVLRNDKVMLGEIGYKLKKGTVIVYGTVGDHVGFEMEGGCILIKGDVGNSLGSYMKGGEILVFGNVGDSAGVAMHAGILMIMGNAGDNLGLSSSRNAYIMISGTYDLKTARYEIETDIARVTL